MESSKLSFIYAPNRIYAERYADVMAQVDFPIVGDNLVDINYTYVHGDYRGQGISNQIYELLMVYLVKQGWKATASCPAAVAWLQKHTEWNHVYIGSQK